MYFPSMALNLVATIASTITLGNSKSLSSIKFNEKQSNNISVSNEMKFGFQMPLHYPRYTKNDYEKMEEWKIDALLREYGLDFQGTVDEKRRFAMGAFLWPDQL